MYAPQIQLQIGMQHVLQGLHNLQSVYEVRMLLSSLRDSLIGQAFRCPAVPLH